MQENNHLTPWKIVEKLDHYIVGQKDAKKQLAIAVRNRWRTTQLKPSLQKEIIPSNLLIIGPTGTGKTECARRIAHIIKAPFLKVEAPKFTERGYVGGDVNEIIRNLADKSFQQVKKQKQQEVKAKAAYMVEELILDTLIPRAVTRPSSDEQEIEDQDPSQKKDINQDTRERFRQKLRKGELKEYKIEIRLQPSKNNINAMGFIGGSLDESAMMNLENMLNKFMPQTTKHKKVTIQEAQKILLEQEMNNLLDVETIKDEAIKKAENEGIVFIDEIDKIAGGSSKSGPNVSREGVQRDLLPIVEGCTVNTKYGPVNTDRILFIAAGAFHIAQPSDLLPELQGRFPIRVKLTSLTEHDFERILQVVENSLIEQAKALVGAEKVTLTFDKSAIKAIAHFAFQANQTIEDIGARRLRTVLNQLLNDILFDIPEKIQPGAAVTITENDVNKKLEPLIKEKDNSRYIL